MKPVMLLLAFAIALAGCASGPDEESAPTPAATPGSPAPPSGATSSPTPTSPAPTPTTAPPAATPTPASAASPTPTPAPTAAPTSVDHAAMPPYEPDITAADFVAGITNPWLPYVQGAWWRFEAVDEDGEKERIEVRVLSGTRDVNGVAATVVRDTVYDEEGEIVEDTYDWFAQDTDGNVWYLGEDTCEFEDGECATREGSFEWGVDGARPGVVMWADPRPGEPYYQEFYEGEAVDRARVVAVGETHLTPLGEWRGTVRTEEWNPLHPDVVERVVYARGVGPVVKGEYDEAAGAFGSAETLVAYAVPGYAASG